MEMDLAFSGMSGILIMLFYGLLMLGIGIVTYMKNRNVHSSLDEYYLGGRGLGTMVLFFTFFATQYSGNTVIGYSAEAYRVGYANLVTIPFFIMIILVYLSFAPRMYKLGKTHNIVTPVDWLEMKFKSKAVSILAAILMLYALANFLLEQLVAIGQGVAGLTGGCNIFYRHYDCLWLARRYALCGLYRHNARHRSARWSIHAAYRDDCLLRRRACCGGLHEDLFS